jgi:hypothetical protein
MPNQPHVRVARACEPPRPGDGIRVLVDRIWPRGLSKFAARLDVWCKQIAPSTGDIPGDDRTAVIAGVAAFLDGMESAHNAGHEPSTVASVASFFVSRLDTKVDKPLDKLSTVQAAQQRGRAAIANACLAYQRYEEMLTSSRWTYLAAAKARRQRPLWASTSTKDPSSLDTQYVVDLVAPAWSTPCPRARFTRSPTMARCHPIPYAPTTPTRSRHSIGCIFSDRLRRSRAEPRRRGKGQVRCGLGRTRFTAGRPAGAWTKPPGRTRSSYGQPT